MCKPCLLDHCIDFGFHATTGTGPVIDLDMRTYPVAVGPHRLEACGNHAHHLRPFAFDDRTHRRELIGQAALVDDVERTRDVRAQAFALG